MSLQLEDADLEDADVSSIRSNSAQTLALISPAGEKIGTITAAARVACCQPALPARLPNQPSQRAIASDEPSVAASKVAASAIALQENQSTADLAASKPVNQAAQLARQVSAAVQTDVTEIQDRDAAMLHAMPSEVHEVPAAAAASGSQPVSDQDGRSSQCLASFVIQSPHFHIYPSAPQAQPQKHPVHPPPVVNISRPTFHFPQPQQAAMLPPDIPWTKLEQQQSEPVSVCAQQQAQLPPVAAAQGSELNALLQSPEAGQAAALQEDFDSWRPVTAVPHASSTGSRATAGEVQEAAGGAETGAFNGQHCRGAHVLKLQELNHQFCHQVLVQRIDSFAVFTSNTRDLMRHLGSQVDLVMLPHQLASCSAAVHCWC